MAEYGHSILGCSGWNELEHDTLPVVSGFGYVDVIAHWSDSWDRQNADPLGMYYRFFVQQRPDFLL